MSRQSTADTTAEQIVVIPNKYYPTLALDLENRAGAWFASVACHVQRAGLDC